MKPVVVLVTGPPGTGKSTLAEHAAGLLGAPVLGWDWVMGRSLPLTRYEQPWRPWIPKSTAGWGGHCSGT